MKRTKKEQTYVLLTQALKALNATRYTAKRDKTLRTIAWRLWEQRELYK
jgi:hypothetical protein